MGCTMSQCRLNHLTVLHIHQDGVDTRVDTFHFHAIYQDFMAKSDQRKNVF